MCDCVCATGCICVCMYLCVCVCVCTHTHTHIYIYIYIYIYTYTYICEFDVNEIRGLFCLVLDGILLLVVIQTAFHEEEFCLFEHFKITNLLISILLLPEGVF
jgi:hypothetical protein